VQGRCSGSQRPVRGRWGFQENFRRIGEGESYPTSLGAVKGRSKPLQKTKMGMEAHELPGEPCQCSSEPAKTEPHLEVGGSLRRALAFKLHLRGKDLLGKDALIHSKSGWRVGTVLMEVAKNESSTKKEIRHLRRNGKTGESMPMRRFYVSPIRW